MNVSKFEGIKIQGSITDILEKISYEKMFFFVFFLPLILVDNKLGLSQGSQRQRLYKTYSILSDL